jgi:hypothetical protein
VLSASQRGLVSTKYCCRKSTKTYLIGKTPNINIGRVLIQISLLREVWYGLGSVVEEAQKAIFMSRLQTSKGVQVCSAWNRPKADMVDAIAIWRG